MGCSKSIIGANVWQNVVILLPRWSVNDCNMHAHVINNTGCFKPSILYSGIGVLVISVIGRTRKCHDQNMKMQR